MSKPLLVVDDDTIFADTLSRSLKRKGYETKVANSIDAAAVMIAEAPFDYAVIDLKLGADSGLELVSQLHEQQSQCNIVVLTGFASITTAVEAIKLGANQYLMKPVEIDDLCEVLGGGEPELTKDKPGDDLMSVKRLEWEHIQRVLSEHDGNVSAAARSLNMHRRTLQRKLQKRPVKR
ncbi:MAG: response regulator transcription factor [Thiotrichales bacterium]|nr:response regulator transcription factor [Thiotrichales bacterium]